MSDERGCEPIAYLYGGITIGPKPPPPFKVGVKVTVSGAEAALSGPMDGTNHILWNYFAVVRPSLVTVACVCGDIIVTKQIDAKPNQLNIVNFCFGTPLATSGEVETSETECEDSHERHPLDTRSSHRDLS